MCRVLDIERTGFYAWLAEPLSPRARDNVKLTDQIKQFWLESGCVYGYRNITKDMRDGGMPCSENRVYRLMRAAQIASVRGYKRHPGFKGGIVSTAAANTLNREFEVEAPNNGIGLPPPLTFPNPRQERPTHPGTPLFPVWYHRACIHTIPLERSPILGHITPATSFPNSCVDAPWQSRPQFGFLLCQ
ncbi:MAG: transposase [Gammaproteobacteria bacterium]|nr:transposase [Gammaproteobacteria bacterium]